MQGPQYVASLLSHNQAFLAAQNAFFLQLVKGLNTLCTSLARQENE
jgi:hypothetical protein